MSEVAKIKGHQTFSKVWAIPLLALMIGGWMVYSQWLNQGTFITIEMTSAVGIEANKTAIKVRDLQIGKVKKVSLNEGGESVLVTAQIDKNAEHLLTETSKFWIVSPRITLSEVSGLNTLLSGVYLSMSGDGEGRKKTKFTLLPRPPVTPQGTPGLFVTLTSTKDFAYKEGDAIVYKGHKVGQFEESFFNQFERAMYYTAFIEAPYHRLINENTRFWDTSGIKIRLRASGLEIDTGSLETLLSSGVSFDVPEGMTSGDIITEKTYFEIFESQEEAQAQQFNLSAKYVLLIDENVRGLNEGAPVEYRGINVGEVVSINKLSLEDNNILQEGYKIPVVISVYPGKVRADDTNEGLIAVQQQMTQWINQNLHATLRMGSLVTGALYVDLHHFGTKSANHVDSFLDYEVIPTASNEFAQITQKAEALLDKLNALPLDRVAVDATDAINAMLEAAESVEASSDDFDELINGVDIATMNKEMVSTLKSIAILSDNLSHSGIEKDIQSTVKELQDTLRSIQPVLQQLNESPSSILFNSSRNDEVTPKAKQGN